jgi:hypothetical protein
MSLKNKTAYNFDLYKKQAIYYLWPHDIPVPDKGNLAGLVFVAGPFDIRFEQQELEKAELLDKKEVAKGTLNYER